MRLVMSRENCCKITALGKEEPLIVESASGDWWNMVKKIGRKHGFAPTFI